VIKKPRTEYPSKAYYSALSILFGLVVALAVDPYVAGLWFTMAFRFVMCCLIVAFNVALWTRKRR
jgi:hypothetical protein